MKRREGRSIMRYINQDPRPEAHRCSGEVERRIKTVRIGWLAGADELAIVEALRTREPDLTDDEIGLAFAAAKILDDEELKETT